MSVYVRLSCTEPSCRSGVLNGMNNWPAEEGGWAGYSEGVFGACAETHEARPVGTRRHALQGGARGWR